MTVRKRGKNWHYDFGNHKYRGVIPEARTKAEAEQAEVKVKHDVFTGKYGQAEVGTQLLSDFVEMVYLPWARDNKRTSKNDEYISQLWCQWFKGKQLRDVSPLAIEKIKRDLLHTKTRRGTDRKPASVNMVLSIGSRIFTLAVDLEQAATNPFRKVKKFAVDNQQERYLHWDEESALMAALDHPKINTTGRTLAATLKVTTEARSRLRDAVQLAIGLGLRRSEQLRLQPQFCDFAQNVVVVTKTKTGRPRRVPMNDQIRATLQRLCRGKRRDVFLFVNPRTKKPFIDYKSGFKAACRDAGIEGLEWRHLRATFGTRLGEAGHNAFDIAYLMGHSDVRTSMRYVRVADRNYEAVQSTMLSKRVAGAA